MFILQIFTVVSKCSLFGIICFQTSFKDSYSAGFASWGHLTANALQIWAAEENADGPMEHKPQQHMVYIYF